VTSSRRLASWLSTAIAIFAAVSAGSAATGTVAADYSQPPGAINPAVTQVNISTTIDHLCPRLDGDRAAAALVHRRAHSIPGGLTRFYTMRPSPRSAVDAYPRVVVARRVRPAGRARESLFLERSGFRA
jgi:hypothetical protein